jgi:hypothetical protein
VHDWHSWYVAPREARLAMRNDKDETMLDLGFRFRAHQRRGVRTT